MACCRWRRLDWVGPRSCCQTSRSIHLTKISTLPDVDTRLAGLPTSHEASLLVRLSRHGLVCVSGLDMAEARRPRPLPPPPPHPTQHAAGQQSQQHSSTACKAAGEIPSKLVPSSSRTRDPCPIWSRPALSFSAPSVHGRRKLTTQPPAHGLCHWRRDPDSGYLHRPLSYPEATKHAAVQV